MPMTRLARTAKRIAMGTAIAFSTVSLPAQAASIIVDGNLSDLESVPWYIGWNDTSAVNVYRGTDPLGSTSTEGTESNNGFDISNVYAYYDWNDDTFYFGIKVYGTVGDSQPLGSVAANEGVANAGFGSNSRANFDQNETYGLQIYLGSSTSDPQLLLYSVQGASNATDTKLLSNVIAPGLTVTHAISEAFNGVEFGVAGLRLNGVAPEPHPNTFTIRFSAGSSDTNGTTTAAEDFHLVTMSAIPVPAAAWLFGSGLAGLLAVARKRRNKS